MGPKFMPILYFECDGTLEVCGPTNFGPDDLMLEITSLTVSQNGATWHATNLPIIATNPDDEWETDIPNAKQPGGPFHVGPATGAAIAYLVKKNGHRKEIAWPGSFKLKDGCAILQEIAPEAVDIWTAYRESGREAEE